MKTFVGFFLVSLALILVSYNGAEAKDANHLSLLLAPGEKDGQCTITQDQFKGCLTNFLRNLALQIPTTTTDFLQALLEYVGVHFVDQGVSDICGFVEDFKKCAPIPCWTKENFNLMGVGADDFLFADGFIGFDNFCTGPGLDILKANAACILPGMVSHASELLNCIQGLDYNNIQNIKCTDLTTAITCAINIIAIECPRDLVLDVCNSGVVAGDLILPTCKAALDAVCVLPVGSTTIAPPPTSPPPPTTSPPPPPTAEISQPVSFQSTAGNQQPTTHASGNVLSPSIAFMLVVIARTVATIF